MSKQLTLSAAVSVIAMAAFAVFATPWVQPASAPGAPAGATAPALEAALPGS